MTEIGGCSNNKDELKVELSTSYRRYLNNCNGEEDNAFVYQGALHSPGLVMENPFEIPSHPALVCIYTTPGRTCTGWPRQTNLRGQRNAQSFCYREPTPDLKYPLRQRWYQTWGVWLILHHVMSSSLCLCLCTSECSLLTWVTVSVFDTHSTTRNKSNETIPHSPRVLNLS